jgi:hypothetical protein
MRLASFSIWGVVIGLAGGCPSDGGSGGSADGGGTGTTMSETGHDHDETSGDSGVDPTTDPTTTTGADTVGEASTGDEEADTTSGPMFCDDLDACIPCRACAIEADCADEHGACHADAACAALVDCADACKREGEGDACEDACIAEHPGGQALALALHQCLVTACPNSCG